MPGGAPGASSQHVAPCGTTLGGTRHMVFCKKAPPGAVQWQYSGEPTSCTLSHAWCSHLLTKVPVALESGSDPVIWA